MAEEIGSFYGLEYYGMEYYSFEFAAGVILFEANITISFYSNSGFGVDQTIISDQNSFQFDCKSDEIIGYPWVPEFPTGDWIPIGPTGTWQSVFSTSGSWNPIGPDRRPNG